MLLPGSTLHTEKHSRFHFREPEHKGIILQKILEADGAFFCLIPAHIHMEPADAGTRLDAHQIPVMAGGLGAHVIIVSVTGRSTLFPQHRAGDDLTGDTCHIQQKL